jgi:hypothetical protein
VFGDEERLTLDFETLCIKRLGQQIVSVYKQQISRKGVDGGTVERN